MSKPEQSLWANVKIKNRNPESADDKTRAFEMLQGFCHDPELSTLLAKYHLFETILAERLDLAFSIAIRAEELIAQNKFPRDNDFLSQLSHDALVQTMRILGTQNPTEALLMMKERMQMKAIEPEFIPGMATEVWQPMLSAVLKKQHKNALVEVNKMAAVNQKALAYDKKRSVKLYGPRKRDEFRIRIQNGRLHKVTHLLSGETQLFSSKEYISHDKRQYAAFTLNMLGELSVFKHHGAADRVAHSTMNAQDAVLCAGEIKVNERGYITTISNHSGHYLPTLPHIYRFLRYLKDKGVALGDVTYCVFGETPEALKDACQASHEMFEYYKDTAMYAINAERLYQHLDNIYRHEPVKGIASTVEVPESSTTATTSFSSALSESRLDRHAQIELFQKSRRYNSAIMKFKFQHFKNAVVRAWYRQTYQSTLDHELKLANQLSRLLSKAQDGELSPREQIELNAIYSMACRHFSHQSELRKMLFDISKDASSYASSSTAQSVKEESELPEYVISAFIKLLYKQHLEHQNSHYLTEPNLSLKNGIYQIKFYDQKNDIHTVFRYQRDEIKRMLMRADMEAFLSENMDILKEILKRKLGDELPWMLTSEMVISIDGHDVIIEDQQQHEHIALPFEMAKNLIEHVDDYDYETQLELDRVLKMYGKDILGTNVSYQKIEQSQNQFIIFFTDHDGQMHQKNLNQLEAIQLLTKHGNKLTDIIIQIMEHEAAVCEQLSLKPSKFGLDDGVKVNGIQFDSDNQTFCISYKDSGGYDDNCQLDMNKVIDALTEIKQHVFHNRPR